MAAVVGKEGGRRGLEVGARREAAVGGILQALEQRFAGVGDDAVLLQQAVDRQAQARLALHHALEGNVLARMVHAVGIVAQPQHDIAHQLVVGLLARVEQRDFPLQHVEQPAEAHVIGVPGGNGVGHD